MIKSLLRLARGFFGIWGELRRLRILVEWAFVNGMSGRIGDFALTIHPIGLPPTAKETKNAEEEKIESVPMDSEMEEQMAAERAIELIKRRAKGEVIDPDEIGSDWDF